MGTTNTLDLNNRVDKLEKAVSGGDSAQANKTDIATEFSTTTNYTAGCFVYYGGKLYQFNTDHTAGAWDPTDVVESNVTDQIVSNKSALDGLTASDVAYDNTVSGLTATDVQGAVDELKSGLTNIGNDTDLGYVQGSDTITLTDAVTNYRFVQILIGYYGSGYPCFGQALLPVSTIVISAEDLPVDVAFSDIAAINPGRVDISFLSATSVKVVSTSATVYTRIVGIA